MRSKVIGLSCSGRRGCRWCSSAATVAEVAAAEGCSGDAMGRCDCVSISEELLCCFVLMAPNVAAIVRSWKA